MRFQDMSETLIDLRLICSNKDVSHTVPRSAIAGGLSEPNNPRLLFVPLMNCVTQRFTYHSSHTFF